MNRLVGFPMNWMMKLDPDLWRSVKIAADDSNEACCSMPVQIDMYEKKDAFKIVAELPGMEKDAIKVIVRDDILTISGERLKKDEKDGREIWSERYSGSFSRSFRLPDSIDKSGVSADYTNGVLEVTLAKKPEVLPKEIEVKVA